MNLRGDTKMEEHLEEYSEGLRSGLIMGWWAGCLAIYCLITLITAW